MTCPENPNSPPLQVIVSFGLLVCVPGTSDIGDIHPAGNGPVHPFVGGWTSQALSLKSSKKGSVNCEKAVPGIINNKKIMKEDELLIL